MQAPINHEHLQKKWAPLLDYEGLEPIKDNHKRMVTAQLLENQETAIREEREFLSEAVPTNSTGSSGATAGFSAGANAPVAGFDPVLISLIRRSMPNLVAYDLAGVQPMTGPTGLIFAMRSKFKTMGGDEALFDEADTAFSAVSSGGNTTDVGSGYVAGSEGVSVGLGTTGGTQASNPDTLNPSGQAGYKVGQGMDTEKSEALGTDSSPAFNEMAFSIEKVTVTAKSRALKAEYSLELAQDLKAIHGLNAEAELANILSTEILAEINREVIRTIYKVAKPGAQNNVATTGTFDLDIDSNGRWSVEKFKGLIFQIERDANAIAQETRRGKGNMIVCSADVASALTMAGVLDYTPALNAGLNVDDTGNTFAGVLQGKYRVYIDPFSSNVSNTQYYVIGYKGTSPYDAGLFYCPYVPLQMVRAVGENSFQPKIGFKTRYGIVANPFAEGTTAGLGKLKTNLNRYYRRVTVNNLM
jgi:FlaG/FlaF family flagellin (archaellin)